MMLKLLPSQNILVAVLARLAVRDACITLSIQTPTVSLYMMPQLGMSDDTDSWPGCLCVVDQKGQ